MIIVAHPDDEVIGLGARLPHLKSSTLVHVTTGAAARSSGQASRRFSELRSALKLAGLSMGQLNPIGRLDQSLSHALVSLTKQLRCLITEQKPDAVFTHPYEGGHPDHDAIAFAVHTACRGIAEPPPIIEMTFYHQGAHGIRTGEFLPDGETPMLAVPLSPLERSLKQSLLDCFPSQSETLSYFATQIEKFRRAPPYIFTVAPHPGLLFYENFEWGIHSGAEWRVRAREALAKLEL
jgi:LmbE family N-acetylglucosaminyl deacetylase